MGYESVTSSHVQKTHPPHDQRSHVRSNQRGGPVRHRSRGTPELLIAQDMQSETDLHSFPTRSWTDIRAGRHSHTFQSARLSQIITHRRQAVASIRMAFGLLWACDACLQLQAASGNKLPRYLTYSIQTSYPLFAPWFSFWQQVANIQPHLFAQGMIIAEICIACSLICGAFTNLACGVGILLTLSGWSALQSLGQILGMNKPDIGVLIVCTTIFFGLLLSRAGQTWGFDRELSHRLGKWSYLASGLNRRHSSVPYRYQENSNNL